MNDEDDDYDDGGPLVQFMVQSIRRGAVMKLMSGNDTGCFTIEQYKKAYEQESNSVFSRTPTIEMSWKQGQAEMHLQSFGDFVREVRPGIWTLNNS